MKFSIVIPIYDDWQSAQLLLAELGEMAQTNNLWLSIFLIDDASMKTPEEGLSSVQLSPHISRLEVISLKRNLGHQRAIAVGLSYLNQGEECDGVIVMDGDGEDRPEDLPKLIERFIQHKCKKVVFAARRRRTETALFKLGYFGFKMLHWLLVGLPVRVGNFSIIPTELISKLLVSWELWNHYAATIIKIKLPHDMIPLDRGQRYAGKSKMILSSLLIHGFSAISVYSETVLARILVLFACLTTGSLFLSTLLFVSAFVNRQVESLHLLGFVSVAVLYSFFAAIIGFATLGIFGSRSTKMIVPLYDAEIFVDRVKSFEGSAVAPLDDRE